MCFNFFTVGFSLLLLLSSCYKTAPKDEDLRTIPSTNNPHVLPVPRQSGLPGATY